MDEKTIPIALHEPTQELLSKIHDVPLGRNQNYRALFEQTSECVFIIGLDLRYLAANPQALRLLGYEEHELIGMQVSQVMSLDEGLTHLSIMGDGPNLYERILKRKDGSTLPVEISASIIYNVGNEPAYIQSIARDISEQKNAEHMLKRQTYILSLISRATARLLQSSNIESRIPEVLEELGRFMGVLCCAIVDITTFSGIPSAEVKYKWMSRERRDFDATGALSLHVSDIYLQGGKACEILGERVSFGVMPAHISPASWKFLVMFEEGNKLSWSVLEREAIQTAANLIGSALQRNNYEEALRLSEIRNRTILSALPDLLIRVNAQGIILDYSANPDHPLYLQRDIVSGHKLSEMWPTEIVDQILGDSTWLGFQGKTIVERVSLPYSNNEYEAQVYPFDGNDALIVIRDITERVRLDQMKSDFINRASHELRTPVTSALLMLDLIQDGGTPDELDEYWRTLRSELSRQKTLIDRLLMAGRLESGMVVVDHTPITIAPVIYESVQAIRPIAHKHRVDIQVNMPNPSLNVIGDGSALRQVFINLISNASKFSKEGSTVLVELAETETEVTVSIVDHGIGIPPEALSHLFERFYRAKNVTVAEIPGSGIGLYIVKSIVEELGGKIEVESELNQGTTFHVTLKKVDS